MYLDFLAPIFCGQASIDQYSIFWCSAFILPQECINKIDSMCNAFLWKGNLEGRFTAKVSWTTVTRPKQEGGLGNKNLEPYLCDGTAMDAPLQKCHQRHVHLGPHQTGISTISNPVISLAWFPLDPPSCEIPQYAGSTNFYEFNIPNRQRW